MGKPRSINRDKAFEIYFDHKGNISPKEIAELLNESSANIRVWKSKDNWKQRISKDGRGAPKGNKNAKGNRGGAPRKIIKRKRGAPKGNANAFKHGLYCDDSRFDDIEIIKKHLPTVTKNIVTDMQINQANTLDLLWHNIKLCYAGILRSQKIMEVKNKSEITKEIKREKTAPGKYGDTEETEYEVQFAWDRQERFLKVQSNAMMTLTKMIREYEDLLHANRELATEEQKARIESIKSKIIKEDDAEIENDGFIEALEGKVDEVWED